MQTTEVRVPAPTEGAPEVLAIETRDLHKRYGDVLAVQGVDLAVPAGEIFGLLGPNGAGKTTAIKMLLGLTRPTSGYAAVFGRELPREAARVRQLVGYVTQEVALDKALTARENLRLVASLYHVPRGERNARINELLEFSELTERADDIVRDYSGGMRKRLDLALGLIHQPRLLIMDEPTLGLDIQTRRRLWEYVRTLRDERGLTILLTTHYLDEADQLCDRVGIIDHGQIVALGPPSELKSALAGDVVTLSLGEESSAQAVANAECAADLVRLLPGVRTATVVGAAVRTAVENAEHAMPPMLDALRGAGIEASGVSYARPSLDDVFLHHTGKSMREG
jgi:ABC-2 type transport system ATP-binding protein